MRCRPTQQLVRFTSHPRFSGSTDFAHMHDPYETPAACVHERGGFRHITRAQVFRSGVFCFLLTTIVVSLYLVFMPGIPVSYMPFCVNAVQGLVALGTLFGIGSLIVYRP